MSTVGEAGGFGEFYLSCYPDLAGYAWSLTRDRTRGEELAQEAMTRAYARWGTLREARPYVFRIVTNLARDSWAQDRREREALASLEDRSSQAGVLAAASPNAELLDAVERLPVRLRAVVLLHYFADLPLTDVATAVRRPLGTVKRRLHEARAMLFDSLQEVS